LVVIHEPVLEISCGQKQCAQTDRHTPMTTRPCGLRRAGNNDDIISSCALSLCTSSLDRIYVNDLCYDNVEVVSSAVKSDHMAVITYTGPQMP